MNWYDQAREAIYEAHKTIPPRASFKERQQIIKEAYPFGLRQHHPYKQWLKAQRDYLAKYRPIKTKPIALLSREDDGSEVAS